jgi:hypothetical protein
MMGRILGWVWLGTLSISTIEILQYCPLTAAESAPATSGTKPPKQAETLAPLVWHDDYRAASRQAADDKQLLLLWFADETKAAENEKFEAGVLDAEIVRPALGKMTLAKLSTTAAIDQEGQELTLLEHRAFAELLGGPGLAMVDFRDEEEKHYGHVVTIYPFRRGPITAKKLQVLCELPVGTLTQRTLMFAVRTHPAAPQSAWSPHSTYLASEAEKHSQHQASILLQGHHNWDTRFQQINAGLGVGGAKEVCAESWGGQSLLEAAEECVHSWSQSSGHWSAVSARHSYFGYDMKRGTNGVWYATGIFGGR